jgi:hypothetical protein
MWVGFVIPTLYFVLVRKIIDQCFGEPEPQLLEELGSVRGLLSSASHKLSNGGEIYIRHEKRGCLDAGMESNWNPLLIVHNPYVDTSFRFTLALTCR